MTDRRRPAPAKGRAAPSRARSSAAASRSGVARSTASRSAAARRPAAEAVRRRRLLVGMVVSVVLVGFLLVAVFPTRTWLAQRSETADAEQRLERIRSEQEAYEERVAQLETPEEVERQAREDYGLVRPGEIAYRVLPGGGDPIELPDAWPFAGVDDWLNR